MQRQVPKDVCYGQCSYLGAKYATSYLKKEFSQCSQAKRPMACRNKINRLLRDWANREVERKLKFEATLRKRLRKAQKRNEELKQKQQEKAK